MHGFFNILLSFCFFIFFEKKYASYRHYSVSLIVIDLGKGGTDKMKLQPSLENW